MEAAPAVAPVEQPQQQGRSWKQMLFQIVMFQMVMKFFSPRQQQVVKDPTTGEIIPPLQNSFQSGTHFDLFVHLSSNSSSCLLDVPNSRDSLVWMLPDQTYNYERRLADRSPSQPIQFVPPQALFEKLISQRITSNSLIDDNKEEASLIRRLSGANKLKKKASLKKDWESLYLIASVVPHSVYESSIPPADLEEAFQVFSQSNAIGSHLEMISRTVTDMIEYMKPVSVEEGQDLLSSNSFEYNQTVAEEPHWKDHIDIRLIYDVTPLTPQAIAVPHLKRYVQTIPDKGLYNPIVVASDLWLLERNFILLNDTLVNAPLNLTLSFNSLNSMWWMIQSQLNDLWNPTQDTPTHPLMSLQSHSRRETFMLKRIILDTNPYLLVFSGLFMLLHSLFSFLAFKNDISFWKKNESMQGLSALSIVFSFFCEVIIALYLFDSEETSFLILFEMFLGVAISAWKVTKAINVSLKWKWGYVLPSLDVSDKKDYEESDTKKYDAVAIKFMSILLLPCSFGYAFYSLKTRKYKSWYSFIISTLAGTVYTFGFIMMTPQLYINYKLKSVDHLPWRAFTYKALNTFVDDIAAFIIDMPLMHRLACFRDDIIFICYLYQRWIYSVDKTRPSEWVDPAEQEKEKQREDIASSDTTAAEAMSSEMLLPSVAEEKTNLTQRTAGGAMSLLEADRNPESKKNN